MTTIKDLEEFKDELETKFGKDTPVAYSNISLTQLSIARHYGGAKIQDKYFVYNYVDDSLIREDVVKWYKKRAKKGKKDKK